jgi:predicted alpha/beta superfamily hydrolase
VRYDYTPDALTNHPAAHVHFNGISDTYNSFLNAEEKPLRDVHFPTDRITVEDFI